jgi:RimJ/RimL family protein N-acetyltransferase
MIKSLETQRLILRPFVPDDVHAVQRYAGVIDNTIYMLWGPNSEAETRAFIAKSIAQAQEDPCTNYQYAAVLRDSNTLIGACGLTVSGNTAEIGWILHRDFWRQGYGSEMGRSLVDFGFAGLGLHRILAHCDAENVASYRVMEKIGMHREGLFLESRPASKGSARLYSDEYAYAILKDQWEQAQEIACYNALPLRFDGFRDLPELSDDSIYLVCTAKKPAQPEKKWVPAYHFAICRGGDKIGDLSLRIGYTDGLYYGGQIGYAVDEPYRGHGYAVRACLLAREVARQHEMIRLLITNNPANTASRRVCEKLGARLVRVARLPEWHDLYRDGQRWSNIFEWTIG